MKKLILSALALFCSMLMFAQNTATATQNGENEKGTIIQEEHGNFAKQYQDGLANEVFIKQIGENNYANQYQTDRKISPTYDNNVSFAKILQSGDLNKAWQIQSRESETAFINQSGDDNYARQEQSGWANLADIFQSGNHNVAKQYQAATAVVAYINQSGNHNLAQQDQLLGKYNKAVAKQSGSNNTSFQTQTGSASTGEANYNYLEVNQMGNQNFARQDQADAVAGNSSRGLILQIGNANSAIQNQAGGEKNEVKAVQTGNHNESYQYQKAWSLYGSVNQSGMHNDARQFQEGSSSKAYIDQSGNNDFAKQDQKRFGTFNIAQINQSGNNNDAYQTQSGSTTWDNASVLIIRQSGGKNLAVQTQGTDGHTNTNPTDDENFGLTEQTGCMNTAKLMQNGTGNWSKQLQTGDSNMSTVTQEDFGHMSTVIQNGNGNTHTVIQNANSLN